MWPRMTKWLCSKRMCREPGSFRLLTVPTHIARAGRSYSHSRSQELGERKWRTNNFLQTVSVTQGRFSSHPLPRLPALVSCGHQGGRLCSGSGGSRLSVLPPPPPRNRESLDVKTQKRGPRLIPQSQLVGMISLNMS